MIFNILDSVSWKRRYLVILPRRQKARPIYIFYLSSVIPSRVLSHLFFLNYWYSINKITLSWKSNQLLIKVIPKRTVQNSSQFLTPIIRKSPHKATYYLASVLLLPNCLAAYLYILSNNNGKIHDFQGGAVSKLHWS